MIDRFRQDLRSAARALRQQPMFTLVAVGCLATGISVNTAAFSLLNAIVFREFPGVQRQSELAGVSIGFEMEEGYRVVGDASLADWSAFAKATADREVPAFSGVAAYGNVPLSMRAGEDARVVRGAIVSSSYFDVLGTRPAAGRFMRPGDSSRDLANSVVISHELWVRAFDSRFDIVGQTIAIGTERFSIIGVTPEGFFGMYPGEIIDPDFGAPQVYLPLEAGASFYPKTGDAAGLGARWLRVIGRLKPGVTTAAAEAQANGVAAQLAAAYPAERREAFARVATGLGIARENSELLIGLLSAMAVPALILLVACANLANQQVARGIQRRREIAVRLSLGAPRSRVAGQLLSEAALVALVAAGAGVVIARWILDALRAWYLPLPFAVAIDVRVLAFSIGIALATALVFGLLPALGATRPDLTDALKDGAPGSGYRRSRARSALVVVQIAASLALIAVASVFARVVEPPRSAWLDALGSRSVMVSMDLDLAGFDEAGGRAFQATLMDRLRQLPGVAAVGMGPFSLFELQQSVPMTEPGNDRVRYLKLGEVTGEWFDAVDTRAIRGRLFTDAERSGQAAVAVVDEEIARYLWDDKEPIGRVIRIGSDPEIATVTVIGVIPTRQVLGFREPEGIVVIPGGARYHARTHFYVRTAGAAGAMIATVREAVRAHDRRVPVIAVRTMAEAAAAEGAPLASFSSGMAALGVIALGLAAIGLTGVLAFIVAQRRYEIGVRMALGAQRGDVVWLVVRQALGLGAAGVLAGTLAMFAVIAILRTIIWGLRPLDPSVLAGTALTMLLVSLLASLVPARRAVSVDPISSLRAE